MSQTLLVDRRGNCIEAPIGRLNTEAVAPVGNVAPAAAEIPPGPAGGERSSGRHRLRRPLMLGGIAVVLGACAVFWLRGGRYASTDDAYVQAAKLSVSTDVSGIVSSVAVHEGELVEAGQVLYQIDARAFEIALAGATANLAQVALTIDAMKADYLVLKSNVEAQQAQVAINQLEYDRAASLQQDGTVSKEALDTARATLDSSGSTLESLRHGATEQLARLGGRADIQTKDHPLYLAAQAEVDEAQRQLEHASVRAPFDGVATQVDSLQPGMYLVAQTAALTNAGTIGLVDIDKVWVIANMKETDLTFVTLGNPVDVYVDTYPGMVWKGTVEAISPASGSEFSILPPQNTSGNWVKVVQRIPVRIKIKRSSRPTILRAGMSVTVEIDTGHRRSLADLF